MDDKTIILMNKIMQLLAKKSGKRFNPNYKYEEINLESLDKFITKYIIQDYKNNNEIQSLIRTSDNINSFRVGLKNGKVSEIIVPEIKDIISALVLIHELTHYITYSNRSPEYNKYMSLYDELAPINNEMLFLNLYYYDLLKEHFNARYTEAIYRSKILMSESNDITNLTPKNPIEIINSLSHIYSFMYLVLNRNYEQNYKIFSSIVNNSEPLEGEYIKSGIYLPKKIIKRL